MDERVANRYAFDREERFTLDPSSPVPLYHQLAQVLADRIVQEGMVGKLLPAEIDLCAMFGVSRVTVQKALESALLKGLLDRRRALGTRITRPQITEDLARLTSYTEEMRARGLTIRTEIIYVGLNAPSPIAKQHLQMSDGDQVLCIRRLRGTNELFPVVLLQTEIPARFGISPAEDFTGSLYALLEDKYAIPILGAEEAISAAQATAEEAKLLELARGASVLVMDRLTFTTQGVPLEYVHGVYRPDRFKYSIRLKR